MIVVKVDRDRTQHSEHSKRQNVLNPFLNTILSGAVGFLLGGYITHRFHCRRELANRRRAFRNHAETLLAKLRDTANEALVETYQAARETFRDECAKIRSDIPARRRAEFLEAASAYFALRDRDIVRDDIAEEIYKRERQYIPTPLAEYPGRPIMEACLARLIEAAK